MCGIAGYSLSPDSSVARTLAAQALLAGIAERGADAVGYASRTDDGTIAVTKLRGGASALLDEIEMPAGAHQGGSSCRPARTPPTTSKYSRTAPTTRSIPGMARSG